jgi:hypothetical protein
MNYDAFFAGREPDAPLWHTLCVKPCLNRQRNVAEAVIKVNRGLLLVEQRKVKLRAAMEHGDMPTFRHTLSIIFTESCLESIARLWTTTIRSFI